MQYFSNLLDTVLYIFRTGPLSIIRSISTLYTRNSYLSFLHYKNTSRCTVLWISCSYAFIFLLSFFQNHLLVYPIMISLSCSFLPYFCPIPSIFSFYLYSSFLFFVLNHNILKIFFDFFASSEYLCPPSGVAIILSSLPLVRIVFIPFPEVWQWRRCVKFFPFPKGGSTFGNVSPHPPESCNFALFR